MSRLPVIGITASSWQIGLHAVQMNDDKYARAVALSANGLPLIMPQFPDLLDIADIIDGLDGLLFTGAPSNIEPHRYGGSPSTPGTEHDAARDQLSLALWRAAVEDGLPVLGICRGFQELNVAFGGTLHQRLHRPSVVHEPPSDDPIERQYARAHDVTVQSGGMLARLGLPEVMKVNSVHSQGVDKVGHGLRVEAIAEDGLVEGLSIVGSKAFALGLQWHPEWQVTSNPDYFIIFQAFGDACRKRRDERFNAGFARPEPHGPRSR